MSQLVLDDLHSLAPGSPAQACFHLNFELTGPACLGLTGPSGSGKSLLLRAIADLDPSGGTASLDGIDRNSIVAHQWRTRVGYLSADSAWWSDQVGDHFIGLQPYGFEKLGFNDSVLNWSVARLSSGERQRLALSRLLSRSPEVMLLDEPTASLDPDRTIAVETIIADYARAHNAPIIWVSHDKDQLQRVAHHRLLLDGNGHIEALS